MGDGLFESVCFQRRKVQDMGLTDGIVTDLLLAKVRYDYQLSRMTDDQILSIPWIGPKRLIRIRAAMRPGHPFFGEVRSELEGMGSVNERWNADE
jgi:hypothetical protein